MGRIRRKKPTFRGKQSCIGQQNHPSTDGKTLSLHLISLREVGSHVALAGEGQGGGGFLQKGEGEVTTACMDCGLHGEAPGSPGASFYFVIKLSSWGIKSAHSSED